MDYRCEATSLEGFIQQLAVSYVARGYWFYVSGCIPERKDPRGVDAKLIKRYDIDLSKWARARRKRAGIASVQYLRLGRTFILLATHGKHLFFDEEKRVKDIRRVPFKFGGYSIGFRSGHAHVRIDANTYRDLKAYFLERATRTSTEDLAREFYQLGFEPYAPVRRQVFNILRAVNRVRAAGRRDEVPKSCVWLKRAIARPFEGDSLGPSTRKTCFPEEGLPFDSRSETDSTSKHPAGLTATASNR